LRRRATASKAWRLLTGGIRAIGSTLTLNDGLSS
jgi:hypothetical protein